MSSAVGEDTARTIAAGRETVGDLLVEAQQELKKAFSAFLVAFIGTVFAMRYWVWDYLKENTASRLDPMVAADLDLVARTPFDVILMQIKIGFIVGAIVTVIAVAYLGRKAILKRADATVPITRTKIYAFVGISGALAVAGLFYAYSVFFPVMFKVLAEQAHQAGVKPTYGIVRYTEFLLLLTISFAIAAQLPLFMGALSYAEIIPYETFRDKWRWAILAIFGFGAVFSPPDPFTQIMWAIPLISLYAISLAIAKIVTNFRRASARGSDADVSPYRRILYSIFGTIGVVWVGVIAILATGFDATILASFPEAFSIPYYGEVMVPETLGVEGPLAWIGYGFRLGMLAGLAVLLVQIVSILRMPVVENAYTGTSSDPSDVDLSRLNAAGVRASPPETFASMPESEAMLQAQQALEVGEQEKAEAIIDQWEEVNESGEGEGGETEEEADAEESDPVKDSALGMVDAFTAEETTEDDVGGYLYDIQFILSSLRSKAFILLSVFIGIFGASFGYLYWRGIEDIMAQFTARVPDERFRPGAGANEATDIVIALHPVEVLLFIVKFSLLLAGIVTLPLLCYYAWPAIQARNFVPGDGDRRGFLVWGAILIGTVVGGAILGFLVLAPQVISYLVSDAIASGMVISYRVRSLLWIVFFFTLGIGLFLAIPVTMALFHYSGLIGFDSMYARWRIVTFVIAALALVLSPSGVLTMLILAIPAIAAYLFGIAILWGLTLPSRLRPNKPQAS